MNLDEKIRAVRVHLIVRHPFIAVPLLRLRLEPDPHTPTAKTDGRRIRYNPEFLGNLPFDQVAFVLAHEAFHVILAHHLRRSNRSLKIWNVAGDFVVNDLLHRMGLTMPPGVLYDPSFSNWSTERVYEHLLRQAETEAEGSGGSSPDDHVSEGFGGSVEDLRADDGGPLIPSERAREETNLATALEQAVHALQLSQGNRSLLQALARAAEALSPRFDAHAALLHYADRCLGGEDYSWVRPNRRYLQAGIYLPSLSIKAGFDELIVAVDTSVSIEEQHLRFMAGACEDILAAFPNTLLRVFYCDTSVRATEEFTSEDLPLRFSKAQGGGGTLFRPIFQRVAEEDRYPRLLIYLTDLFCADGPEEPPYPVLWLSVSKDAPSLPFGERIDLDL